VIPSSTSTSPAEELAALDSLDTGVRGGPEPEDVTCEAFGREIPEA
jgi:2,5-diketo-D-gluconate reductase A